MQKQSRVGYWLGVHGQTFKLDSTTIPRQLAD